MPRPTKPVAGEEIRHELGQALVAYAGEQLRFVRNRQTTATSLAGQTAAAVSTKVSVELTQLPANDERVVFAYVSAMCRGVTAGENAAMSVYDADDLGCGSVYTSGTANRGGHQGPFLVPMKPSGTNRRSIKWACSNTTAKCWLYVWGWWEVVG
jgi:hypothetical protein